MNLTELLKKIVRKKILVIGDVMLDNYYFGSSTRISPEAPVPVLLGKSNKKVLGGAANVALNLVGAGCTVSILSIVGDDSSAADILSLLQKGQIDASLVLKDKSRKTTVKTRFIGQNNMQMFRFDEEDTCDINKEIEKKLIEEYTDKIKDYDIVIISDYNKGLLNAQITNAFIDIANKNNKRVLVDVKGDNYEKYRNAYLLKPNLKELSDLTKTSVETKEDIITASKDLLKKTNVQYVLTTLGKDGMMLVSANATWNIECVSREVYDVTGAGDTVIAYLAVSLANDIDVHSAANICSYAAGVKVSRMGTYAVKVDDIIDYIVDSNNVLDENKVISISKLEEILANRGDKKVVFTNGCFDIFHVGHLRYLKESAKYGDMLIVGLNTDASIRRLKGQDRPIVNEQERAELLSSLSFISYVVLFDEDTPYEIIKRIKPDIITKGGDYNPDTVVGKDIVEARGGKVIICPLVKNKSTTNIINKVLEVYHE